MAYCTSRLAWTLLCVLEALQSMHKFPAGGLHSPVYRWMDARIYRSSCRGFGPWRRSRRAGVPADLSTRRPSPTGPDGRGQSNGSIPDLGYLVIWQSQMTRPVWQLHVVRDPLTVTPLIGCRADLHGTIQLCHSVHHGREKSHSLRLSVRLVIFVWLVARKQPGLQRLQSWSREPGPACLIAI